MKCLVAVITGSVLVFAAVEIASAQTPSRDSRRTPVVEAVEAVRDSVVNIAATQTVTYVRRSPFGFDSLFDEMFDLPTRRFQQKRTSAGSGFVIHRDGYIVTNAHVVRRTTECKVIFADGRELDATIVAADTEHDLAILAVESPAPLKAIKLGRSDDLMIGETVIAVGNPLGYQNTVTTGVVSALDRKLEFSEEVAYGGLIQTDASINPGNSGGPLLNINGELIGINTAIRGDAQNIGFAIPVAHLRRLLPGMLDLERHKRGAYLGLRVGGGEQAIVTSLVEDGPTYRGGIRIGDRILSIDGIPTLRDIDAHIALLGKEAGERVAFEVRRNGQRHVAEVTVASVPKPDAAKLARRKLGLELEPLPPTMARRYGMRSVKLLLIRVVERDGPGDRIGIEPGDILFSIGRYHVHNLDGAGQLLEALKSGELVDISILRVSPRGGIERQEGRIAVR